LLLVEVDEHLRVAGRAEAVALGDQLRAELGEVVELPVVHDPYRAVLVRHRLVARREVDDAEAPVPEYDAVVGVEALPVRSPRRARVGHPADELAIRPRAGDPADAAHRGSRSTRFPPDVARRIRTTGRSAGAPGRRRRAAAARATATTRPGGARSRPRAASRRAPVRRTPSRRARRGDGGSPARTRANCPGRPARAAARA